MYTIFLLRLLLRQKYFFYVKSYYKIIFLWLKLNKCTAIDNWYIYYSNNIFVFCCIQYGKIYLRRLTISITNSIFVFIQIKTTCNNVFVCFTIILTNKKIRYSLKTNSNVIQHHISYDKITVTL